MSDKVKVLEQTSEEKINSMTKTIAEMAMKIRRYSLICATQKNELRKFSLKLNEMDRELIQVYSKLDEIGGCMMAAIRIYGNDNKLGIVKSELENILPGTMLDDSEETDEMIYLSVVEMKNVEDVHGNNITSSEHDLGMEIKKGQDEPISASEASGEADKPEVDSVLAEA